VRAAKPICCAFELVANVAVSELALRDGIKKCFPTDAHTVFPIYNTQIQLSLYIYTYFRCQDYTLNVPTNDNETAIQNGIGMLSGYQMYILLNLQ
jgi:hypothetical protein